jgi:chemotaxis protein methyltransferase CheR
MGSHIYHIIDVFASNEEVDISWYDEDFLTNSATRRCEALRCKSMEDYIEILEKSDLERMSYFDCLHIGYSSFFRNPLTYHTLEKIILPELVAKTKNNKSKDLRIWSAACAAGQEAYSIAMLLEEQKICTDGSCNCMIFATDKDDEQIEQAYKGQYARHYLDNISLYQLNKWFIKYGDTYFIIPELKKRISFSVFDLFDKQYTSPPTSIFGHFDIIFCANLLFYYKEKYRKIILEKIEGAMAENCFLITGDSERSLLMKYNYLEVYPQSAIFRKK